jgi:hypothetical protein
MLLDRFNDLFFAVTPLLHGEISIGRHYLEISSWSWFYFRGKGHAESNYNEIEHGVSEEFGQKITGFAMKRLINLDALGKKYFVESETIVREYRSRIDSIYGMLPSIEMNGKQICSFPIIVDEKSVVLASAEKHGVEMADSIKLFYKCSQLNQLKWPSI